MINLCHLETHKQLIAHRLMYNLAQKVSSGVISSHPGHLPLLRLRLDFLNLQDSTRLKHSVEQTPKYVKTTTPTQSPLYAALSYMTPLHSARRRLPHFSKTNTVIQCIQQGCSHVANIQSNPESKKKI